MPNLLLDLTHVPDRHENTDAELAKLIKAGRCDIGTRLMSLPECEAYARTTKRHFLGRGVEVNEYPGCVVWDPTGQAHVEYNEHPNDKGKTCESLGGRGECVCFQL